MKSVVLVVAFILVGSALANAIFGNNEDIVALEGYEHGVAFCGDEWLGIAHAADAHAWKDDVATYVVNEGHKEDPEVQQLVQLAKLQCCKE